jgi:hypothetical protein
MTDDLAMVIERHAAAIDQMGLSGTEARSIRAYLAYPFIVWMGQAASLGECRKDDRTSLEMCGHAPQLLAADNDAAVCLASRAYRVFGFWGTARLLGVAFRLMQASKLRHQS